MRNLGSHTVIPERLRSIFGAVLWPLIVTLNPKPKALNPKP